MNHVWLSIALSGRMKECAQALARPSALIRVWFDLKGTLRGQGLRHLYSMVLVLVIYAIQ
jgi:hypothetical protein